VSADAHAGRSMTHIELADGVPIGLAEEIERRLLFVSSDITGYELITDNDAVTGVVLRSDRPADAVELARKVNLVVDTEIRPLLVTPNKVIWRSTAQREVAEGTFDALAASGLVTEAGEGQVALAEPLMRLFDYFDRSLLGVLQARFAVTQYRYPTLIRASTLRTAGYVSAFPQHVMFVTRLHNDIDVYRNVQDEFGGAQGAQLGERLLASCRNIDYMLPPTMCFHTFSQYRGRTIARGGVHVVSARGKAFRYEAGYSRTLERLWDFTIREMVFLGTRDEVLSAREQTMEAVLRFLDGLGVTGLCEVGNDPFFGRDDSSDRVWSQRMMELKYELRLPVGGGRSIAVGSFNFHNDLFGTGFGIAHEDGGPAWSGCIGFGLERLVYAFVCQFGADEQGWPQAVRDAAGPGLTHVR
jgi:seryl-tRNA synthetase